MAPKKQNKKRSAKAARSGPPRSALQNAGAKFYDELGNRALATLKKRLGLNTENHRFYDTVSPSALPASTSGLTQIASPPIIPQGNTNSTRVGDSIRVEKMIWRLGVSTTTGATSATRARFICVYRKLSQGAGMSGFVTAAQILNQVQAFDGPYSPNLASDGITVLWDKTIDLGLYSSDICTHTLMIPVPGHHMKWTAADTTGALANLCESEVTLWAFYDNATGGGGLAADYNYQWFRETEFVDN